MGLQLLVPATVNLGSASTSTKLGHKKPCSDMVFNKAEVLTPHWVCENTIADIYDEICSIICNNSEGLL
jgi:hypothetical protein